MSSRAYTGRTRSRIATVMSGTIVGQVVSLAATPVLSRIYEPAQFGDWAVLMAAVGIVAPSAAFSYEDAIPLADGDDKAIQVLLLSLVVSTVVALLALGVVGTLNALGLLAWAANWVWAFPLLLISIISYRILSLWAARIDKFRVISRSRMAQALVSVGVQASVGLAGLPQLGLIVGAIAGQAVGCALLLFGCPGLGSLARRWLFHGGAMLSSAREYISFPLYRLPRRVVGAIGDNAIPIVLVGAYSTAVAGEYSLMRRIVGAPLELIGTSVSKVIYPAAARARGAGNAQYVTGVFRKGTLMLGVGALMMLFVVGVAGRSLVGLVLGSNWIEAARILPIVGVMVGARLVAVPAATLVPVMAINSAHLVLELVRVGTSLLSLVLLAASGDVVLALSVCGGASAVVEIALVGLVAAAMKRASGNTQGKGAGK